MLVATRALQSEAARPPINPGAPPQAPARHPLPPDSLLAALRSATARCHADIEVLLALDAHLGRARYAQVMRGFEAFLRGWEPQVAAALGPAWAPWLAARARWRLAAKDLEALGVAPSGLALPRWVASLPQAVGALYVMEGSALGAQVIARQVGRELGLGPEGGCAYFNARGARTGAMWREFQDWMAERDAQGLDRDAACEAAVRTFAVLSDVFRKEVHVP